MFCKKQKQHFVSNNTREIHTSQTPQNLLTVQRYRLLKQSIFMCLSMKPCDQLLALSALQNKRVASQISKRNTSCHRSSALQHFFRWTDLFHTKPCLRRDVLAPSWSVVFGNMTSFSILISDLHIAPIVCNNVDSCHQVPLCNLLLTNKVRANHLWPGILDSHLWITHQTGAPQCHGSSWHPSHCSLLTKKVAQENDEASSRMMWQWHLHDTTAVKTQPLQTTRRCFVRFGATWAVVVMMGIAAPWEAHRFVAQKHHQSHQRQDCAEGSWAEPLSNIALLLDHF